MSKDEPRDRLSDEDAKKLIKSIADVEREEAAKTRTDAEEPGSTEALDGER